MNAPAQKAKERNLRGGVVMTVYRCENSLESIFTAVYMAYERKNTEDALLVLHQDPMLFAENVRVKEDLEKVYKVMNTLKRTFGEEDYQMLCLALASEDEAKAQAVFGTIRHGLQVKSKPNHLFDHLAQGEVLKAFKLGQNASREVDHLLGFLRFQELENKILYAEVGPKNNVVTFLAPHFADRLPQENFVIYDDHRGIFIVHPAGGQWYIRTVEDSWKPQIKLSEEEFMYQALFRRFCNAIAIKARENKALQQNMLPLRFQKYMIEF